MINLVSLYDNLLMKLERVINFFFLRTVNWKNFYTSLGCMEWTTDRRFSTTKLSAGLFSNFIIVLIAFMSFKYGKKFKYLCCKYGIKYNFSYDVSVINKSKNDNDPSQMSFHYHIIRKIYKEMKIEKTEIIYILVKAINLVKTYNIAWKYSF